MPSGVALGDSVNFTGPLGQTGNSNVVGSTTFDETAANSQEFLEEVEDLGLSTTEESGDAQQTTSGSQSTAQTSTTPASTTTPAATTTPVSQSAVNSLISSAIAKFGLGAAALAAIAFVANRNNINSSQVASSMNVSVDQLNNMTSNAGVSIAAAPQEVTIAGDLGPPIGPVLDLANVIGSTDPLLGGLTTDQAATQGAAEASTAATNALNTQAANVVGSTDVLTGGLTTDQLATQGSTQAANVTSADTVTANGAATNLNNGAATTLTNGADTVATTNVTDGAATTLTGDSTAATNITNGAATNVATQKTRQDIGAQIA